MTDNVCRQNSLLLNHHLKNKLSIEPDIITLFEQVVVSSRCSLDARSPRVPSTLYGSKLEDKFYAISRVGVKTLAR